MKSTLLPVLLSVGIALAGFGPNVRIDHEYRPNRSCINCTITVGPGAPSSQPLYVAFQDDSMVGILNVLSDVMFQKSTDAGRTWLPTGVLVWDGDPHAEDPDITTDSDGNIHIVWEDWHVDTAGGHEHRILCSRSSDGGTTWTAPARVDDRPDPTKWGIGGQRIAADSAGNLLCAWYDERMGSEGHIWSSVSTDRGATWSQNVRVCDDTTDYGCCPEDVFVQPGTNHYLVAAKVYRWMDGHARGCSYLYRSTDMGRSFQPGVQLDTFNDYAAHPHVVADRDHIICDYFGDGRTVPLRDTMIAEARTFYTQGDSWGSPVPVTNLDSLHELYYSGPLALSGDGRVHTALTVQDTVDHRYNMYYTSSSDHGVSWSDIELVSDDTTVNSHYPDIGADSAGHAYIVWYQPNAGQGEVWFATNAPAGIAEEAMKSEFSRALGVEPNPFARSVSVLWELPSSQARAARVYAQDGRLVRQAQIPAGERRWVWDGRDDSGAMLPPGVYVLEAGPGVRAKVVKLK
jgi:hypothetical protein